MNKENKTIRIDFRLQPAQYKALVSLASFQNMSIPKYIRNLIEKAWQEDGSRILIKDATVKALKELNITDKIIGVIEKPEDIKNIMGEEKYNEFYEIYKKYKLEAK